MPEFVLFTFLGLLYIVVIAAGTWLLLGPERRHQMYDRATGTAGRALAWAGIRTGGLFTGVIRLPHKLLEAARMVWRRITAHRLKILAVLSLMLGPAVAILAFAPGALDGYEDTPISSDPVVLGLLRGEQLVPPPPLPPELFVTEEVQAERREIVTASREWRLLDADFRQRLLTVYRLMAQHGYQMALLEGYRSPERQEMLAHLGSHVTNARAFQSYHQFGLAADSAFYRNGKIVISEKDPWAMEGYRLYGHYAESVGLVWGGRWKMMDFGHVELKKPQVLGRR